MANWNDDVITGDCFNKDTWKDMSTCIKRKVADYIIYADGATYYALNGNTGNVDFSDTDIGLVLQDCVDVGDGICIYMKNHSDYYHQSTEVDVTNANITIIGGSSGEYGTDPATRIIQTSGANLDNMFDVTGKNFRLENIYINGNKFVNPTANRIIYLKSGSNDAILKYVVLKSAKKSCLRIAGDTCHFLRVTCEYAGTIGFYLYSAYGCTFIDCFAGANDYYGFYTEGASYKNIFFGCYSEQNGIHEMFLNGTTYANNNKIVYCHFSGAAGKGEHALRLSNGSYNIIQGCTFENVCQKADNIYSAIQLKDFGANHSTHNMIMNNMFSSTAGNKPRYGINESNVNQDFNNICHNTIEDFGTANINHNGVNSVVEDNI